MNLHRDVLIHDESTRARVTLVGPDARAFLHRMSTNHVDALTAGQSRLNVLTTDKGRIVDLVHHIDLGERGVLLVGSAGRGETVRAWLDRYIFTEKIELADVSSTGSCALITGGGWPELPKWGSLEVDGRIVIRTFDRVDQNGAPVSAFLVVDLANANVADALGGVAKIDDATNEVARIAAGIPGPELNDIHNPLDLDLHDAIHWAKGCYIGQEVIARLDTYQKQSKHLVGLVLDPTKVSVGDAVHKDGAAIGAVTSVSPRVFGTNPSALAVVRLRDPDNVRVVVKAAGGDIEATARTTAATQRPSSA